MTDETTILGWHFAERGVLAHGDDRTLRVGETYRVEPPIQCCARGLHASERVQDAWGHCEGRLLCRVECSGEIDRETDKVAAQFRRVLDIRRVTRSDIDRLRAAVAPARSAYDAAIATAQQAYDAAVAPAEQAYRAAIAPVELDWYAALPIWEPGDRS